MKVEIDVQPLGRGYTGVSTYLRNLIAQFRDAHPDVALRFVADHPVPELAPAVVRQIGPAVTNMKTKLVWETFRLPVHSLVSRPDILHIPYHSATAAGRGRRVVTVHDCHLWTLPPGNRAERVYRTMLGVAARRADFVLTDSEFSAGQIEALLGIDRSRIGVVPLACAPDIPQPRSPQELDSLRVRYALDRPFILYAGGTAGYKGIDALVDAYTCLHGDLRGTVDLVILGRLDRGIAHHATLLDRIAACPAPGRIVIPGIVPQADLGAFYQAAQLFVFPSFYEGFGLSPLEAMACGTPVLASDRASIPEVVGDAAILIDPARPATIVAALEQVLPDPERLSAMRLASRARADLFSWTRTADLTRAAYDAVLAR
jgi:alpha-1,3-rhamnosyl/mannosyltransferase